MTQAVIYKRLNEYALSLTKVNNMFEIQLLQ